MATDPYSWAARVGEQGYADKQNAENFSQNALMQVFQEEAARQRPFVQLPAAMAEYNMRLAAQEPYQIAQEQRALENDMALRRYYAENPIPRAPGEEAAAPAMTEGSTYVRDGVRYTVINGTEFPIGPA